MVQHQEMPTCKRHSRKDKMGHSYLEELTKKRTVIEKLEDWWIDLPIAWKVILTLVNLAAVFFILVFFPDFWLWTAGIFFGVPMAVVAIGLGPFYLVALLECLLKTSEQVTGEGGDRFDIENTQAGRAVNDFLERWAKRREERRSKRKQ
jgi:hypothetical protein